MDAVRLMKELKLNHEQEGLYLPKEMGLKLIEAAAEVRFNRAPDRAPLRVAWWRRITQPGLFGFQGDSRISARGRDSKVEDLWSLTSFFGYSTKTFVLAVNLLDRFLAMIKVRDHPEANSTVAPPTTPRTLQPSLNPCCNLTISTKLIRCFYSFFHVFF